MASINRQCQLLKNTVGQNKYHFPLQMLQHLFHFFNYTLDSFLFVLVVVQRDCSLNLHLIGSGSIYWLGLTILLKLNYYVYKANILAAVVDVERMSWWWYSHNPPLKQWTTLSWWLSTQQVPQQQRHWCYRWPASIVNAVFSQWPVLLEPPV